MPEMDAPTLEMLWEERDPHGVLETRFGLADGAVAGRWVATTLDEHWGIRVEACDRIVMSDHNALAWVATPSGRLLAKWSVAPERFPRLGALARLAAWLGAQRLPVSAPVAASDGRPQVEADGASLGLQRVIEGDLLDTADHAQVREAGAVLARLHSALASYPHTDGVPVPYASATPLADQVTGWLDAASDHLPTEALHILRRLVAEAPADPLPTQLVHGDYRSANILCTGRFVTAVLDFEEARFDHRVVELARSAVLLGTRFRDWGPVSAAVRAALIDGYESESPLTAEERAWFDVLVLWYSLACIPAGNDPTGWRAEAQNLLVSGRSW